MQNLATKHPEGTTVTDKQESIRQLRRCLQHTQNFPVVFINTLEHCGFKLFCLANHFSTGDNFLSQAFAIQIDFPTRPKLLLQPHHQFPNTLNHCGFIVPMLSNHLSIGDDFLSQSFSIQIDFPTRPQHRQFFSQSLEKTLRRLQIQPYHMPYISNFISRPIFENVLV